MKRVPTHVVKSRTRRLTEYFRTYSPYTDRLGAEYTVLVTETSHDGNYYVGHNQFYEQVNDDIITCSNAPKNAPLLANQKVRHQVFGN